MLAAGLEVFVLGTEPGYVDSLNDRARELKLPLDKLHWMSVLPSTEGWDALTEMVTNIASLDIEGISKIKGIGKEQTRVPAQKLLSALPDFRCERAGKSYGSSVNWGTMIGLWLLIAFRG